MLFHGARERNQHHSLGLRRKLLTANTGHVRAGGQDEALPAEDLYHFASDIGVLRGMPSIETL